MAPGGWKADNRQSPPGALTDHMLYELIRMFGPVAELHAYAGDRAGLVTLKDTTATLLRTVELRGKTIQNVSTCTGYSMMGPVRVT